jgi:hypothetical protein
LVEARDLWVKAHEWMVLRDALPQTQCKNPKEGESSRGETFGERELFSEVLTARAIP